MRKPNPRRSRCNFEQLESRKLLAAATQFVSDLTPTTAVNGWGPYERDTSNGEDLAGDGRTITLNGVTYDKGLGVHSDSDLRYALNGQYARFTTDVGIDDEEKDAGSVIIQVWADGTELFDSGVMTGSSTTQHVDVDITGKNELQLLVLCNGGYAFDHTDWANAQIIPAATTPTPTSPPPTTTQYLSDLTPTTAVNGWGPYERDTSNGEDLAGDGKTITLNGTTYDKGLGVHSDSDLRYALNGQYARFTTDVGIDDEEKNAGDVIIQVWADDTELFDSGVMTGSSTTQHVDVDITGKNELRLLVLNSGGYAFDHTDWADAQIIPAAPTPTPPPAPQTTQYISDLTPTTAVNGWGPYERDTSNGEDLAGDGRTITLNGVQYTKGLGVHAVSDMRYALNGQFTRFQSDVGVDDEESGNGSVTFQVWADGVTLFDSGVMNGSSVTQNVDVDLTGKSELRLLVLDDGSTASDHADWADARLLADSGTTPLPPAPVANAGGPYAVAEGGSVLLDGSASTSASSTPGLTYAWDLDGDGVFGETGTAAARGDETGVSPTFSAASLDGPGSATVALRVTDTTNQTSTVSTATVNVTNVAPTLNVSGQDNMAEGSAYTLNLSAVDPGQDTISEWVINWGDGSAGQTVTGSPSSITHTYADDGAFSITATATDEDGSYDTNTQAVTVTNVAPTLAISGDTTVNEGSSYSLNLASSDPGQDAISQWTIDWGDGSAAQIVTGNPGAVAHTYADGPNSFQIFATATDEDGTYAANIHAVTVNNVAPILSISGISQVNNGTVYTLNLASADVGSDTISSWTIRWGDGSGGQVITGNPDSVTHTYSASGDLTISATATDEDDTYPALNTVPVTVLASGGPVAEAGGPYTAAEGGSVVLNGSASAGKSLSYAWDLDGDGIFGETGSAATRGSETGSSPTFLATGLDGPSSQTVRLRVTDNSNRVSINSATIDITNVAPTLAISGNSSVNEGATYTLNLAATDPGVDTISQWVINWGDSSPAQTITGNPSSVTHSYADGPNSYTITATATDEDGNYSSNSKSVTVNNVPPTLTISGNSSVSEGSAYTLNLSRSDPGPDTVSKWVINWGDGGSAQTVSGNPANVTHTYADGPSTFSISATATDEDGTYNANSISVSVLNVAPTLAISGNSAVTQGSAYTLNLSETDPGADSVSKWVINWGDGTAAQTITGNPSTAGHTFSTSGNFTISASVTDEDGTYSANTQAVSVTAPASANAGGPYTVAEGGTVALTGSVLNLLNFTAIWDMDGDGIFGETGAAATRGNETGLTPTFNAAGLDGPGSVTVNMRVADLLGLVNITVPATINITNVAPTLTISGSSSATVGSAYTLNLAASDPGPDAISQWTINWGDGTSQSHVGNPASATHTYGSVGNVMVSAVALDEDGVYSTNSMSVNVTAPATVTANVGGPYTVAEGGSVALSGAASTGTALSYAWDLDGDGVFGESGSAAARGNETGATPTFGAAGLDGPGSVNVSLRVTDSANQSSTASATINITSVAPVLTISGNNSVTAGSAYTLNLAKSDPGPDTISKWVITWGDGTAAQTVTGSATSVSHTYAAAGSFTISATATDEDGTYSSNTKPVNVTSSSGGPSPVPAVPGNYSVGGAPDFVASADFNGDARPDLVTSSYSASSFSILINNNGTFGAAAQTALAVRPDFVTTGDLNGDGRADLVFVSFDSNSVVTLIGNGNGTFQTAQSFAAGTGPRAAVLGDFNGDGRLDVALAKSFDRNLTILVGNGNGSFQSPLNTNLGFTPSDLVGGDFNKDGKYDLAAADFFNNRIAVLLGNGNATFLGASFVATASGPTAIAAADFDGDGSLDLATANFNANNVSVLNGIGNGTFAAATNFAAGSGATAIVATDVNADGRTDLVVANANSNNASILTGTGTGSFNSQTLIATGTSPRSVIATDINGDGDFDIVTANQGTNTISVLFP